MRIDESYRLSELTIPWDWAATHVCCSVLQCVAVCCQSSPMSAYKWVMAHKRWSHVTYLNSPFRATELPHMCVAVCYSVLQCVAECCSRRPWMSHGTRMNELWHTNGRVMSLSWTYHSVRLRFDMCALQCVAVCCNILQTYRSVRLSFDMRVLQCVAVCCSVLQCVAVCCSVLRCVALGCRLTVLWDSAQWSLLAALATPVCVCVCQCLYVYSYTLYIACIHTYAYIETKHSDRCLQRWPHRCVCVCLCVCVYSCTSYVYTHIHTKWDWAQRWLPVCVCVCVYACVTHA